MTEKESIVMYNSEDAATYKTGISGWVTKDGRFWGKDEHIARYAGCTHVICDCGDIAKKSYTKCQPCRIKASNDHYNNMPFKEWDGETPLCEHNSDKYFFGMDDIDDYCDEYNYLYSDLKLIICEANKVPEVDPYDIINDIMPEDCDEIPYELGKAFDELNSKIKEFNSKNTISWEPGKYRTSLNIKRCTEADP